MPTRRDVLIGGAAAVWMPLLAGAASNGWSEADEYLRKVVAAKQIPGAVSLVTRKGAIDHVDVVGLRDIERGEPMTRDTIFRIASMTKPITAVAALMLVDDGVLTLDEPVNRFLPELAARRVLRDVAGPLDDTVAAPRALTLRDLLTYRAGYTHWAFLDPATPLARAMQEAGLGSGDRLNLDITPDEFARRIGKLPLAFAPGTVWQYQTPSELAGILIRRAARQPFDEFLAERLFGPLGMRDTGFWVPDAKLARFSSAYALAPGKGLVKVDDAATSPWRTKPQFPSGAGGLVSTADDYRKFAQMLLDGGVHRGRRILRASTLGEMVRNHLPDSQRLPRLPLNPATPRPRENLFDKKGFGLGVAVAMRSDAHEPAPGSYGWGGLYGTDWTNDPRNRISRIFMMQVRWGGTILPVGKDYARLVYSAMGV